MAEEENNTPEAPETEPEKDNTVAEETPAAEVATEAPQSGEDQKQEDAPAESEKAAAEGGGDESKEGAPDDQKKDEKRDIFAEIMGEEAADAVKIHKAKSSKNVSKGIIHVAATFNNTMVTVTDQTGNTIGWSSSGKMGFKGSRKSTAYAAQVVSQDACRQAMGHGLKEAEVRVKGPGAGRESAVRAVQAIGIDVSAINDVTPIPHNGCRPKKARRV
ncbi:MAG: 30S ribosomal protein S11 [Verrucomicrobia bacterium]|jgi:small subunit ribosomal protein S11|nr:30S ribosomal protein S11 [Roseibacillus sp.]RCL39873.1 MAG: 30S ribosomal protein S11 [Verrucomicrobiota bacterium]RPF91898.1 MAG: 30S ribosomal protein S11 [Roseibacillus sp. TMED18]